MIWTWVLFLTKEFVTESLSGALLALYSPAPPPSNGHHGNGSASPHFTSGGTEEHSMMETDSMDHTVESASSSSSASSSPSSPTGGVTPKSLHAGVHVQPTPLECHNGSYLSAANTTDNHGNRGQQQSSMAGDVSEALVGAGHSGEREGSTSVSSPPPSPSNVETCLLDEDVVCELEESSWQLDDSELEDAMPQTPREGAGSDPPEPLAPSSQDGGVMEEGVREDSRETRPESGMEPSNNTAGSAAVQLSQG